MSEFGFDFSMAEEAPLQPTEGQLSHLRTMIEVVRNRGIMDLRTTLPYTDLASAGSLWQDLTRIATVTEPIVVRDPRSRQSSTFFNGTIFGLYMGRLFFPSVQTIRPAVVRLYSTVFGSEGGERATDLTDYQLINAQDSLQALARQGYATIEKGEELGAEVVRGLGPETEVEASLHQGIGLGLFIYHMSIQEKLLGIRSPRLAELDALREYEGSFEAADDATWEKALEALIMPPQSEADGSPEG